MSRLDLARALLLLTGVVGCAIVLFIVVLHREERRRSGWSTRSRMAHSHWAIDLRNRMTATAAALSLRRLRTRKKKKIKQRL